MVNHLVSLLLKKSKHSKHLKVKALKSYICHYECSCQGGISCLDAFIKATIVMPLLFFLIAASSGLRDLMSFWTGWEVLPPYGQRLWLQLDDTREATSLAESKACFHRLILQSSHADYVSFKSNWA